MLFTNWAFLLTSFNFYWWALVGFLFNIRALVRVGIININIGSAINIWWTFLKAVLVRFTIEWITIWAIFFVRLCLSFCLYVTFFRFFHKVIIPLSIFCILSVIIDFNFAFDCSYISRNHLLDQTQQNCLRLWIFYLYFERLRKMTSIHVDASINLFLEDIKSMFEFKTFKKLLYQIHTKRSCIVRKLLSGYFFIFASSGCSYWKSILFLPLLYYFSTSCMMNNLLRRRVILFTLAYFERNQNWEPHHIPYFSSSLLSSSNRY